MIASLICPVRGHSAEETQKVVDKLESDGWIVHWPPRDTDQNDETGYRICADNLKAIESADRVFVVWDGKSQGSLFDFGIAFALHKPITVISAPGQTPYKSMQNVMYIAQDDQGGRR